MSFVPAWRKSREIISTCRQEVRAPNTPHPLLVTISGSYLSSTFPSKIYAPIWSVFRKFILILSHFSDIDGFILLKVMESTETTTTASDIIHEPSTVTSKSPSTTEAFLAKIFEPDEMNNNNGGSSRYDIKFRNSSLE